MAVLPVVLMAASAAMSAVGAISSAQAQSASYKSQQQAANYNATVEKQNAAAAQAAASANEMNMRRQNDQIMGAQRARVAESAGGFTGTNVGVLAQSGANLELSALNTRYEGAMRARGLLAQSNLSQYQGQVAGMNAGTATTSGYIGAAAGILGSTANYYNARYLYGGMGG
jgi:hypothetical protein